MLAEAFGEAVTEQRQEMYCSGLADMRKSQLQVAFRRALYELKWFPKLAELRELAGSLIDNAQNDGRPGPEEAWARMPKGERMEDDSIVWCEEERTAYFACRSLLLEGDSIGARMAFKERYQKELAEARSQERPTRWEISAGYDVEHRMVTLAAAVQEKRISLRGALNFVPEERQDDFARMLPPSDAKGLLTGNVEKKVHLPGLDGVLAKIRMDGDLPSALNADPKPVQKKTSDLSPEEWHDRREQFKAQAEALKRSRNGHKDPTAP